MSSWNILKELFDSESNQAVQKAVKDKTINVLMDEISIVATANGNKKLGDFMKQVALKVKQMEGSAAKPDVPASDSAFA